MANDKEMLAKVKENTIKIEMFRKKVELNTIQD